MTRIFIAICLFSQILRFTWKSIKPIEKLSRQHMINSFDVWLIYGLTVSLGKNYVLSESHFISFHFPRFSLETTSFSSETKDLYWRPLDFCQRPPDLNRYLRYSSETSRFSSETSRFSREPCRFSSETFRIRRIPLIYIGDL